MNTIWYFIREGVQEGPYEESAIGSLVSDRSLGADALVWRDGMSAWLPLEQTELSRFLFQRTGPPPLPKNPTRFQNESTKSEERPRSPRGPFFKRTWVQVLLLIFFPYVQVPLMWFLKVFSVRTRVILSCVGAFLTIAYFSSGSADSSKVSSSDNSAASSTSSQVQEDEVSWEEINSIYSLDSRYTDLQKKEEWKRFEGKRVNWSGEVASVSDDWGGLTLQIKMNSSTFVSDLLIRLKRSERDKAMRLQKGDPVTFSGKLDEWGTLLPITLSDGEIE